MAPIPEGLAVKVKDWLQNGSGERTAYQPWLTVQAVPSRGQASRWRGRASGRVHHFLSKLELDCCVAFDWMEGVKDIREQYPLLPLEETLAIAASLKLRHPAHPRLKHPVVMTTDLVVVSESTKGEVKEAIAVKPSAELQKARVREKLEIERQFWTARGVRWGIVTERELPGNLIHNLHWAGAKRDLSEFYLPIERVNQVLEELLQRMARERSWSLSDICAGVDDDLGLQSGSGLSLIRYAIASKIFEVDLAVRIDPTQPLQIKKIG